jgi:hypothetical protein
MDWTNIIIFLIGGSQAGLGLLVLLKNPKNKINLYYSAALFILSAWVISTALFRLAPTEELVRLIFQFKLSFGLLVTLIFEIFTLFFPYQKNRVNLVNQTLIAIPVIVSLFFIIFYPQHTVSRVILNPGDNFIFVNKFFWALYSFSFTLSLGVAFCRLFVRLKEQIGFPRVQLIFIIVSGLIPSIFAWFFNIIFLFFDYFVTDWLGAFLTIILTFVLSFFILFGDKKIYIK